MPPVEVAPLVDEALGAGRRQPRERAHLVRRQLHAIGNLCLPVRVVAAAAGVAVEEPAGDIGPRDFQRAAFFTSEWDLYANKTYQANFPNDDHEIRATSARFRIETVPVHDLLLAGSLNSETPAPTQ